MVKYKRKSTGYYAQRYNLLLKSGFEDWEAMEIVYGTRYTTFRRNKALGKTDPAIYLQRMIRSRRLYVGNLRRRGYSPDEIHRAILNLYEKKGWFSAPKGFVGVGERRDPLRMLRDFRRAAMDDNEYFRPKRSHHKQGITRDSVKAQGARRRRQSDLEKYDKGRGR
ncbi:MAG: hypothetical protein KKD44_29355 [Proteobacteria bacterium]|nr:hypothetical protein [Pseudomonadota bacterium]